MKYCKTILAADRDNLVLWDGYARLERQRGNVKAARGVYATTLQAARLSRSQAGDASEDEVDLWAGWAELEWEAGDVPRCQAVTVAAALGEGDTCECIGRCSLFSAGLADPAQTPSTTPLAILKATRVS
jgi:hypothetical protein